MAVVIKRLKLEPGNLPLEVEPTTTFFPTVTLNFDL